MEVELRTIEFDKRKSVSFDLKRPDIIWKSLFKENITPNKVVAPMKVVNYIFSKNINKTVGIQYL